MSLDLARLRAETPGTLHGIHLNNAGASLMPAPVVEAVKAHLDLEARHGGHGAAERAAGALAAVRPSVARLIGAQAEEIALGPSATWAWISAFRALARGLGPADRILISRAEYGASLVALRQAVRHTGVRVEAMPCDGAGRVDAAALGQRIGPDVRLIAATAIPSNGGLVNPVAEIGRIASAYAIPYLLDACQMVGQRPVDVTEIGATMLAATGRKFLRGPRGTGFLYVRRDWIDRLEPVMLDHTGAPLSDDGYAPRRDGRRFELYEHDHAGRLGLGAAADYALALGLDAIAARNAALARRLRDGIVAIPGAVLHDLGPDPASLVTLTLAGIPAEAARARLAQAGIATGLSLHAAAPLDAAARGLPPLLRLSPHYYNDADEIARTLAVLGEIAASSTGDRE